VQEQSGNTSIEVVANTSLVENGVLDSFGIVQLVAFMEQKYEIKLEADDLVIANFNTVDSIASLIVAKKE
jgi:acyl carrier protein